MLLGAAGILVASMVIWMWRTARNIKSEMETKLSGIVRPLGTARVKGGLGLFLFTFVMVFREGVETVLFLFAATLGESFRRKWEIPRPIVLAADGNQRTRGGSLPVNLPPAQKPKPDNTSNRSNAIQRSLMGDQARLAMPSYAVTLHRGFVHHDGDDQLQDGAVWQALHSSVIFPRHDVQSDSHGTA